MPQEGKPRWPSALTNRDVLWGPETRRGDKELLRNESDLGFIQASQQDGEEMGLEKSHGLYLRDESQRWALKSTQGTGLENRILWCHWGRDLCPGLGWKGSPSPWQWAEGGLGFRRTNPICAQQKIKRLSKGCFSDSQVTVAVPLCALQCDQWKWPHLHSHFQT